MMGGALQETQLGANRGWLGPAAAASIKRIDAQIGHPMQITEAGRTWAQQKAHWDTYQRYGKPIALHPDTPSIHQLGNAVDTDEGQRILSVMHDHGWVQTVFRNGKLVEPWHFEYNPSKDNHYGEEADMPLDKNADYEAFRDMLQRALRYDVRPTGVGPDSAFGPTVFEYLNGAQNKGVTEAQVKQIADAVVKAIGTPKVDLDYAKIAKAVNDDAARRMTS